MSRLLIPSATLLAALMAVTAAAPAGGEPLQLSLRSRDKVDAAKVVEKPAKWEPNKTALVVIDVWDRHWCDGANRRVADMAPRFSAFVDALRDRGVFVVHAPSDTMKTYEGTPGRKLAQSAPTAEVPEATTFKWNYLDPAAEGQLPIDDSDGGCDCQPQCKNHAAWKSQHPAIHVKDGDAITDNGREVYNLFRARGIENVIVCGVHTNMCVLGRSFGIRQLTRLGFNVALVRDLTDTMYNPRMRPFVPHEKGTKLVIEHVEKHWAPTISSDQILGSAKQVGSAKRQAAGAAQGGTGAEPRIVFVIAEDEYFAKHTMPGFASELTRSMGWKPKILQSDSKTDIPGLEAIDSADLLVLYMRRRELPDEQLNRFKKYFESGKPFVALRTSSHAFQNWPEFDDTVLGCNYTGHHGNGPRARVAPATSAADHPVLRGVSPFDSAGSLYKSSPLASTATPMLTGSIPEKPPEPVAWTNVHKGGRVFYTSLGHPDDFKEPRFRKLLTNAILWALDRPIEK